MARPLAPLKRLLRLRERVEQGEKAVLRQAEMALRTQEELFHSFEELSLGRSQSAAQWQTWQQGRDGSWQQAQALQTQVDAHMQTWQQAKREQRQAELLLERRSQQRAQEQEAKEIRQQEDWIRARDARREEES